MSMRLFDLVSKRDEEIEKAAFVPLVAAAGRGLMAAGKYVVKNPLKSLSAGLTGQQLASDTKKMSDMANRASRGVIRQQA